MWAVVMSKFSIFDDCKIESVESLDGRGGSDPEIDVPIAIYIVHASVSSAAYPRSVGSSLQAIA
jgi:hypothetical protein